MKLPVVTCRLAEQRCFYHFAPFSFFFLLSPLFLSAGKVCPAGKLGNFCSVAFVFLLPSIHHSATMAPLITTSPVPQRRNRRRAVPSLTTSPQKVSAYHRPRRRPIHYVCRSVSSSWRPWSRAGLASSRTFDRKVIIKVVDRTADMH